MLIIDAMHSPFTGPTLVPTFGKFKLIRLSWPQCNIGWHLQTCCWLRGSYYWSISSTYHKSQDPYFDERRERERESRSLSSSAGVNEGHFTLDHSCELICKLGAGLLCIDTTISKQNIESMPTGQSPRILI